jgi:hypothetical protein
VNFNDAQNSKITHLKPNLIKKRRVKNQEQKHTDDEQMKGAVDAMGIFGQGKPTKHGYCSYYRGAASCEERKTPQQ